MYNGKSKWRYKKLSELIDIPAGFDKNILDIPVMLIDVSLLTEADLNRGCPVVQALLKTFR
ncbi:MAG: hypothetical protein LBP59_14460, partial [Planctomycetaceae bacterium]|nr:hypothetical protein [Planctomycetaceae bacterium]